MAGNFDDIIRQVIASLSRGPEGRVISMPDMQTPAAPPNILGPEYDNLPEEGRRNVLSGMFPDPYRGFTPQDSIDKALEDYASEALRKGTYK